VRSIAAIVGAWKQVAADVKAGRLTLVSVTASLVERANAILDVWHLVVSRRSLDAIRLACAERCQSRPLCSNDARIRTAGTRLGLPLGPVPRPSPGARPVDRVIGEKAGTASPRDD
jgi:hypothetical protein